MSAVAHHDATEIQIAVAQIVQLLKQEYPVSKKCLAVLLLQEDDEIKSLVARKEPEIMVDLEGIIESFKSRSRNPLEYEMALHYRKEAARIAAKTMCRKSERVDMRQKIDILLMHPILGTLILAFILYWALYRFVGGFGAGTVVNFIEIKIFEQHLNPLITQAVNWAIPWKIFQDLLVGEYGVFTLGLRYAVALILPIVTFFFIVFSIIEDTGYLPRLAMLLDRSFKNIGLSGRAVIPMVLGLGCATMATLVTRTLPTKRERVIATLLLALAVPCSAQLAVILTLLSGRPKSMMLWLGVLSFVFIFIGFLSKQLIPGEKPSFYMELPPLRWPHLSNIALKTYVRVKWYFQEILPLFLLVSVFIWVGQLTGVFDWLIGILRRPIALMGLPPEAARIFLFGFFRRDYGAAGLYDLDKQGVLNGQQLVVAAVALTLFLPCIAQFLINIKERGWKTGLAISVFILFFSFSVALSLNFTLTKLGVIL